MRRVTLLAVVALGFSAAPAQATEEYASLTGRPCAYCHENPSGGGTLTAAGTAFGAATLGPPERTTSTAPRWLFGGVLFVHIGAAFMWFGTILYVHIVLKPAYAARGLPRGELRIGQAGVLLVAITGGLLAFHRVPSLHVLFHTRFGVLLLVKIALFLIMATTAIVVTVFIRPRLGVRGTERAGGGEFTAEALSSFDGQDGRPGYVAYQGKVFDLSRSPAWQGGVHMMRHRAGADLTVALAQAPHSPERLTVFPEVGRLVAGQKARPLHEQVFYAMAYISLGVVVAVLLVITAWRS